VRCLAYEAADAGLLTPDLGVGIRRIKGAMRHRVKIGNWLTAEQGKDVLQVLIEGVCLESDGDYGNAGKPTAGFPNVSQPWKSLRDSPTSHNPEAANVNLAAVFPFLETPACLIYGVQFRPPDWSKTRRL
jgi:hypothetical protein